MPKARFPGTLTSPSLRTRIEPLGGLGGPKSTPKSGTRALNGQNEPAWCETSGVGPLPGSPVLKFQQGSSGTSFKVPAHVLMPPCFLLTNVANTAAFLL